MRVIQTTSGRHLAVPMKDKHGQEHLVVLLKYTFIVDVTGRAEVAGEDAALPDLVDHYNGESPERSSILKPSQLFEHKPGTDVMLVGHAYPPRGSAAHVDVMLRVGPINKTVRAHGKRVWRAGALHSVLPSAALPIRDPVPLVYELAWGGLDLSDPEHVVGEPRNYVGRGVARDPRTLIDKPAAQLEYPDRPIGRRDNVPASFGAIHRHWQPRASYAGTYDAAWMESKMPLLPDDFDARFHVCVPHDQWSPTPLRGDELFEILGATPEGAWRFRLPRRTPGFSSFLCGQRREHRAHLDTIWIDANARRVELTFRAAIPMPRKYEMLEDVLVFEKTVR
ncbi:DUF2169 family type VI secretion system accessory protein [Sorangium sp. So ce388]|uniref:DUF2169 family type VI secretion system accessory protein n=1 Tax=Sorangium sp. So ce388 TaxID=3133309 RepID=UPI003F5BFCAD